MTRFASVILWTTLTGVTLASCSGGLEQAAPVATAATPGPYARTEFGTTWTDVDHNGCDTRNDVLARDMADETTRGDCVVLTGTLHDPYTGRDIAFDKTHPAKVQIDHVVSLADAWRSGADQWTRAQRTQFANDPLNLLAVDGPENQRKSDQGPAEWTPPAQDAVCGYALRYVVVKIKWGLDVNNADRDALGNISDGCL